MRKQNDLCKGAAKTIRGLHGDHGDINHILRYPQENPDNPVCTQDFRVRLDSHAAYKVNCLINCHHRPVTTPFCKYHMWGVCDIQTDLQHLLLAYVAGGDKMHIF